MAAPIPYLLLPGTARTALEEYRTIFGGSVGLHTYEEFGRTDGPADAIAHGELSGPVPVSAADAAPGEATLTVQGLLFALLGAAEPDVLRRWFDQLAAGGEVVSALERREWGAWDGQVRDRFGVTWLIGWEEGSAD